MFMENKFKVELITNLPADAIISCYRCGPMVDLCTGPHIPNTGYLKALTVSATSRAHWRADVTKDPLVRVYAVSFPDKKDLKDYQYRMEEAKKRDHRKLGIENELFFFHPLSPGSAFFNPHGARIYNAMMQYLREKYWEHEYEEVMTPNAFNLDLWRTSGHADHYKENMFLLDVEGQEWGLKPMNCPAHCLMFDQRSRSYKELPLRLADFGTLHRNEYSGALSGLTRVRRFQQDDAHIFCTPEQIQGEVSGFLSLMAEVYGVLGLEYELRLSTRPEGFLGEIEVWNAAEKALADALNSSGRPWEENPGDGAFYGPKIDITVFDALRRRFQCATVQLDFQQPIRFGLTYVTPANTLATPVIVHRAVYGSMERMIAILTEHFAGKFPLWMSPRQVMVIPISEKSREYAWDVQRAVRKAGFFAEVDARDGKMQKKVRDAQLAHWNYILVVGEEEAKNTTVNVRTRDNVVHGEHTLTNLLRVLQLEKAERSLVCQFEKEEAQANATGAPKEMNEA